MASFLKTVCLTGVFAMAMAGGSAFADEKKSVIQPDDKLDAVLWVTSSAEYKASTLGLYNQVKIQLDHALADKNWTAALEQGANYQDKRNALIVDIDECILLNMPFQSKMIDMGLEFDRPIRHAWVKQAKATPVPGALALLNYAASKGVRVFYVTSRKARLEEATKLNLKNLGFPLEEGVDTILTRGERPDWKTDKGTRRAYISKDHRVLALIGDNLGDFLSDVETTPEKRSKMVEQYREMWGVKWFDVPNPIYGSWEQSFYQFDHNKTEAEKRMQKHQYLAPFTDVPKSPAPQ